MATRTIKLRGNAYSESGDVSLVVNFNGVEVHNGTVTTINSATPDKIDGDTGELATWTIDTGTTGDLALSIAVSGGDLIFDCLYGNYHGGTLGDGEADHSQHWGDMNTNSAATDGKKNVQIDGAAPADARNPSTADEEAGEWHYKVYNGSTLTCDYAVEAALVDLT